MPPFSFLSTITAQTTARFCLPEEHKRRCRGSVLVLDSRAQHCSLIPCHEVGQSGLKLFQNGKPISSSQWTAPPSRNCLTACNGSSRLKLDGYRAIAVKADGRVNLFSRRRKPFDHHYPLIVEALGELSACSQQPAVGYRSSE